MSAPVRLIVCGAKQQIATQVRASLLPEYDVIYGGHSLPDSAKEVPKILSGSPPAAESLHTQVGSNDFSQSARAVVTGGGYSDEAFQTLYQGCVDACGGAEAGLPVPFFRVDNEITARLKAKGTGPVPGSAEYSQAIAKRTKDALRAAGIGPGVEEKPENKGKVIFF